MPSPVVMMPTSTTPSMVPLMVPTPPARLVPPMTTAGMTSNSNPGPERGWAEMARPAVMTDPTAYVRAASV